MAAPAKDFVQITDSEIAPDSPETTGLVTKIRDALEHLEEWLGKNFVAAVDHDHDDVNSKLVAGGFLFGDNAVDASERTTTSSSFVDLPGASITIPSAKLPGDRLVHTLFALEMKSSPTAGASEVRLVVDGIARGVVFSNNTGVFIRFGDDDSFLLFSGTSPVIKLQFRQSVGDTNTIRKSHLIVKLAE